MLVSPDKFIRKAYLTALAGIGAPVYADQVPIDIDPTPALYVLISSQTKQRTAVSKQGWEWNTQITLDITFSGAKGFSQTDKVDDLEGLIVEAIENGVTVDGFYVKSTILVNSQPLNAETDTQSVKRRILIYEHWVCQV